MRVTPRQRRFVREFLRDFNGRQAAIRAGYPPASATEAACHLKNRQSITAGLLRKAMAMKEERLRASAERVLLEYARIAFSDVRHYLDWGPGGASLKAASQLDDDQAAAIAEIVASRGKSVAGPRLKLHSKDRALAALARHFGIFAETAPGDPMAEQGRADAARAQLTRRLAEIAARRKSSNGRE